jgi:Leucine-rich repeat (LRR) protein
MDERLTSVQSMMFSGGNLKFPEARAISDGISASPDLHTLSIARHNWRRKSNTVIIDAIRNALKLRKLHMMSVGLVAQDVARLTGVIPSCIEYLNISSNPVGHDGLSCIGKALGKFPNLKFLSLGFSDLLEFSDDPMTLATATDLGTGLRKLRHLKELRLQSCNIDESELFVHITSSLRNMTTLKRLVLKDNGLDDDCMGLLLWDIPGSVEYLDVSGNEGGEIVIASSTATSLVVENMDIGEESQALLGLFLRRGNARSLRLRGNFVGDVCVVGIAPLFPRTLHTLCLSDNCLGDLAMRAIAEHMTHLAQLYVSHNFIEDSGGLAIAKHLPNAKRLTTLDISRNSMTDIAGRVIANAALRSKNLKFIYAYGNNMSSACIDDIQRR